MAPPKQEIEVSLGDKSSRRSAKKYKRYLDDMYRDWEGFDRTVYGPESERSSYAIMPEDRRARLYQLIAQRMAEANDTDLSDVKVRLGGTRFGDYYGGVWNNKRLGVVSRAATVLSHILGAPSLAIYDKQTNQLNADHYNPTTNAVNLYHDNPAVLTHELGHAIDFNKRTRADRFQRGYDYTMDVEQQANAQGGDSVRRAFKDDLIAYRTLQALRRRILPKAYGTYKDYYGVGDNSRYADYGGGDERFKKYENMSYDELYNTLADRLLGPAEEVQKAASLLNQAGFAKAALFSTNMLAEGLASRLPGAKQPITSSKDRFARLQARAQRYGGVPQYIMLQAKKKKKTPQEILAEEMQEGIEEPKNPFVQDDTDEDEGLQMDDV